MRRLTPGPRRQGSRLPVPGQRVRCEERRVRLRAHKVRERNRGLLQRRKALAMKQHGKLACEACGCDFQAVYGELDEGVIECHTVPVSQLQTRRD